MYVTVQLYTSFFHKHTRLIIFGQLYSVRNKLTNELICLCMYILLGIIWVFSTVCRILSVCMYAQPELQYIKNKQKWES